ncbi:MAG TPA: serine hydrolase, partial [Holophagaceae bacterium]|nr:serine hydrolase [Holophagaceae bacterium]
VLAGSARTQTPAHTQAQSPAFPYSPASIGDGWSVEPPAEAGFDPARLSAALAGALDGRMDLHGLVVERRGHLVAEAYRAGEDKGVYSLFARTRAFGPAVRHDTRSVGKSVIGLLVGIAQAQGKLGPLSTPVLDGFPEFKDLQTPDRRAITLEHLLTMSSGLDWQEGGPGRDDEHKLYWKWTPAYYVLSRPVAAAPGTRWTYNSGGCLLLADLVERATGTPLKAYVQTRLFGPLGITDWEWVGDLHGRPMAFTGLRMRPRDMAKLGRLVLDHGRWEGRQLVPETWIAASLTPRLETGFDGTRYGYFWWTGTVAWHGRELPWAAAFGNGGQRIFVVPDLDLCVVTTAGDYGSLATARRVDALLQEIVHAVVR